MQNQPKTNKTLWKSIKTQKTKYSCIDLNQNSLPFTHSQQNSIVFQHHHSLDLELNHHLRNHYRNQLYNGNNQQYIHQLNINEQYIEVKEKCHSQNNQRYQPISLELNNNIEQPNKIRKHSGSRQSVVQEVVDLKNNQQLSLPNFQSSNLVQMTVSLASQTSPRIQHTKLKILKEQLENIKNLQFNLNRYIITETKKYRQLFQITFNNVIAYILDYFSNKYQQEFHQFEQYQQQKINHPITHLTPTPTTNPSQQTPQFSNKQPDHTQQSQLTKLQKALDNKIQQLAKLQQQLFTTKFQNATLSQSLANLSHQNQQLSQIIFDYQQRIPQIQLQIQKKVSNILNTHLQTIQNNQLQHLKYQHTKKLQQLQQHIANLQNKIKYQETAIIIQQQKLTFKQQQLNDKQISLIAHENQLNSLKIQIQIKIDKIHQKENQLQRTIKMIEQKSWEINQKQMFINNVERQFNNQMWSATDLYQINRYKKTPVRDFTRLYNPHSNSFKFKKSPPSTTTAKQSLPKSLQFFDQQNDRLYHTAHSSLNMHHTTPPQFNGINSINSINSFPKKDRQQLLSQKNNSRPKLTINLNHNPNRSPFTKQPVMNSTFKNNNQVQLDNLRYKLENLKQQIKKEINENY